MTKGIKISIKQKRELYLNSRDSKNPKLKHYYKSYCKILSKIIKEAKRQHYNKQILTSHNKTRTVWNIVKTETGRRIRKEDVSSLTINGELIQSQQVIANSFNDYFLNIAEKLMTANQTDQLSRLNNNIPVRTTLQKGQQSYTNIKFRYTSTDEIERIIKSLKIKNSQGYDEISTKILKWSAPSLLPHLHTFLINLLN